MLKAVQQSSSLRAVSRQTRGRKKETDRLSASLRRQFYWTNQGLRLLYLCSQGTLLATKLEKTREKRNDDGEDFSVLSHILWEQAVTVPVVNNGPACKLPLADAQRLPHCAGMVVCAYYPAPWSDSYWLTQWLRTATTQKSWGSERAQKPKEGGARKNRGCPSKQWRGARYVRHVAAVAPGIMMWGAGVIY